VTTELPFVLVQHPDEQWWPVGVEEALIAVNASLPQSFPFSVPGYHRAQSGPNRINLPPGMKQPDLPPVFYHELLRERGMDYHRWWSFYLYNPGPPILKGEGRHEADWECVQIAYTPHDHQPQAVSLSQHHGSGLRFWWSCEPRDNKIVIYDALGSHAKYFTPGFHGEGPDVCGHGREIMQAEVRELRQQPWFNWDGNWGNSTGVGKSPVSPGRQRRRAHLFMSGSYTS
jgi:hypothetical protein